MGLGTHARERPCYSPLPTLFERIDLREGFAFPPFIPPPPQACRKSHFGGEAAQNETRGAANARGNSDGDGEPPRVRVSNGCVLGHDPTKGGTPHGCGVATKGE